MEHNTKYCLGKPKVAVKQMSHKGGKKMIQHIVFLFSWLKIPLFNFYRQIEGIMP